MAEGGRVEASGVDRQACDGALGAHGWFVVGAAGLADGGAGADDAGPTSVGSGSIHMKRPSSAKVTRKNASRSAPTTPARSTSRPVVNSPKSAPSMAGIFAKSK